MGLHMRTLVWYQQRSWHEMMCPQIVDKTTSQQWPHQLALTAALLAQDTALAMGWQVIQQILYWVLVLGPSLKCRTLATLGAAVCALAAAVAVG
jgi:hypothetical protein